VRSTGAQAVCGTLEALGVRHVFAYPGSEITELLEGLRASALRTVVPTSELAGCFAAAGYARASGEVGVAAVIPGPGLAYALPGLAEARYDSLPLLVLTGVNDAYAPFDLGDAVRPVAKAVLEPGSAAELAPAVLEGHALAAGGEPGPVVVRLPPAALAAAAPPPPSAPAAAAAPPAADAVAEVARRLAAAARVTLLLGQGAAGAATEAVELVERLGGAVLATTSGRGIVPESHERSLVADVPGRGAEQVNRLLADSDVVLAVGCRFNRNATLGDRLSFDRQRLVHVDTSLPEEPARRAGLSLEADAGTFLRALLAELPAAARSGWEPAELERRRRELERSVEAASRTDPRLVGTAESSPKAFFDGLRRVLPDDGVLAVDSGLHQQLARRYFQVLRPRTLLLPSDFQSMGFALPAALGAALARPERRVVALLGDGGLAISGLELLTASRSGVALTVIVFNDGALNLIRLQQLLRYGSEHGVTLAPPNPEALAQATGAHYVRVAGDPEPILAASLGSGELRLLEVVLEDSTWLGRAGKIGSARRAARAARSLLGR
jgi:acetolactate synthase-1/2/3 large subunit